MSAAAAPQKAVQQAKSANPPNQTLYCTNLNDKLQKHDLRRALYTIFSTYGSVLDVVAQKTMKMRGQAFIVFKDVQASTQAMRALQGVEFFGKEMQISYAKGKSKVLAQLDGTLGMMESKSEAVAAPATAVPRSIFDAPPSSLPPLPPKATNGVPEDGAKSPQRLKRAREEESDEEAPMDVDDDEDAAMEESDDD